MKNDSKITARGLTVKVHIPIECYTTSKETETPETKKEREEDCLFVAKGIVAYIEAFGMPPLVKPMDQDKYSAKDWNVAFQSEDEYPWCVDYVQIRKNQATFHMISGF